MDGHLFQSRFSSVGMDEDHLVAAAGYVSLNPVRARLVSRPWDWPWSSVRAHLAGVDDALVSVRPVLDRIPDFKALWRRLPIVQRMGELTDVEVRRRHSPPH